MPFGLGGLGAGFGRMGAGSKSKGAVAPQLTLLAPTNSDAPWFDFDVPANLTINDQIEVQYGTSSTFAGATSVVTTLTMWLASYATLDLAQSVLTNSTTYYFRARFIYASPASTSPWSATQSYTVATSAIPVTPTATTDGKAHTYNSTSADLPIAIARDFDFGQPDAARNIILWGAGQLNTGDWQVGWINTDKQIAAANLVGTALTKRVSPTLTSGRSSVIFSGVVASHRSGRIMLTGNTGTNGLIDKFSMGCFRAYGLASGTPTNTDSTATSTPADNFNIGAAFTMPVGGFAIAVCYSDATFASRAWQNSFTEKSVGNSNGTAFGSAALRTASGSTQAAIARGNFQTTDGCVAAWN